MKLTYETPRLILRVLSSRYYKSVCDFNQAYGPVFNHFEAAKPDRFYTLSYQKRLLAIEYNGFRRKTFIRYYLFLSSQPETIIGTVSFGNITGFPFYSAIMGYKIAPPYQRCGYAYEALSCLITQVFSALPLHRITAYVMPQNQPSLRLVQKLFFQYEGMSLRLVKIDGNWEDHCKYSLIREQWFRSHKITG